MLKLKVPAKVKPGSYLIKLSFTPQGAKSATTRNLKLKVTKKGRSAGRGKAAIETPAASHLRGIGRDVHAPRKPVR
jgi:hypothetical protein